VLGEKRRKSLRRGYVQGRAGSQGIGKWVKAALWVAVCMQLVAACGQAPAPGPLSSNVQESRQAPAASSERYDLVRDEERGGHTLKKHVGRTDEQLQERLRRERNITAASTWTNRDAAELTVGQALRAEQGRVDTWMSRGYPRANLALQFDAGHPIGRSLRHGEEQAVNCTSAVIVLRADGPGSYYVLTAYPEARE
jgi:Bacterial CdiA-CT RNAse A domain